MKAIFSLVLIFTLLAVPLGAANAQSQKITGAAPQAVITVTTPLDEYDTGANCSLREAIQSANTDTAFGGCTTGGGDDIIQLPTGIYTLTLAGSGEDINATGDLDIDSNITIYGADQLTTIIDGNALDRVLDIHSGTVVLNDLTISGGHAPDGAAGVPDPAPGGYGGSGEDGQPGGGIRNAGDLTLFQSTVRDNQAGDGGDGGPGTPGTDGANPGDDGSYGGSGGAGGDGGAGGGVYNLIDASLLLDHSTLRDNFAGVGGMGGAGGQGGNGNGTGQGSYGGSGGEGGEGGGGGGIYNAGADAEGAFLSSEHSLIQGNLSGAGGDGGNGGDGGDGSSVSSAGNGGEGGPGKESGFGGGVYNLWGASFNDTIVSANATGAGGSGGAGGAGGEGYAGDTGGNGGGGGYGGEGGYSGDGGGIYHRSPLELVFENGVISYNSTGPGGDAGSGGPGGNGVSGTASGDGGDGGNGGDCFDAAGSGPGGGIASSNSVSIYNSKISNNWTGPSGSGGAGGPGGSGGSGVNGGDGGYGGSGSVSGDSGRGGGLFIAGLYLEGGRVFNNRTGNGGQGGIGGPGGQGGDGAAGGLSGDGGQGGDGASGAGVGAGGGIYGMSGSEIYDSIIDGNFTGNGGMGGVAGAGGNGGQGAGTLGSNGDGGSAGWGGRGGDGAGIAFSVSADDIRIFGSTSHSNICGRGGDGGMGGDSGTGGDNATGIGGAGGCGSSAGQGCGIRVGETSIQNTTISGNTGGAGGAGGNGGTGVVTDGVGGDGGDATFGGGIFVGSSREADVFNLTIVNNVSSLRGGTAGSGSTNGIAGTDGQGGGVFVDDASTGGVFTFTHTIIADNDASFKGKDCNGDLASANYNLVEQTASCNITGVTGKNLYGVDPLLAPLGANGGPTETHLPLPGSLALDRGSVDCLDMAGDPQLKDQRGSLRPVDYDGNGFVQCDIGAVEVQEHLTLTVGLAGDGFGSVQSQPLGIDCGAGNNDCSQPYDLNTVVTLTASAVPTATFAGWSGDCSGMDLTCAVTMDMTRTVTATFDLLPTFTMSISLLGDGTGNVSSLPTGIDCGDGGTACTAVFYEGMAINLTATAAVDSAFTGWGGDASGVDNPVLLTMDSNKLVEANFAENATDWLIFLPIIVR